MTGSPRAAKLDPVVEDGRHCVLVWGSVAVVFWKEGIVPEVCRDLPRLVRRLAARRPEGKLSVVSVSLPGARAPTSEARDALMALTRETESALQRVAVVHEGQGFIAAAVVSVVTGIRTLAKPKVPLQPFRELATAIRWAAADIGDKLGGQAEVESLVGAIERERARLQPQPPNG